MILWFCLVSAAFAGKWDGKVADIVATRTIAAPVGSVYEQMNTPAEWMALFPNDCADFGTPFDGDGVGAKTVVTYTAAGMHRRLDAIWKTASVNRLVDVEHPGPKGFITRIDVVGEGTTTNVTMTTYLNAPPKLIRGYFYTKVQPAWVGCHERTLGNLDKAVVKG